jgi:CBS domain-containing protein
MASLQRPGPGGGADQKIAPEVEDVVMALLAKNIMRSKVRTVSPDTSLPDLERALLEARRTGFPVVERGRLVGVVSHSDIVRKLATEQSYAEYMSDFHRNVGGFEDLDPVESIAQVAARVGSRLGSLTVKDVMSRTPVTVSPDDLVSDVAQVMVERRIHRVPVTHEGRLDGIITSFELLAVLADKRVADV